MPLNLLVIIDSAFKCCRGHFKGSLWTVNNLYGDNRVLIKNAQLSVLKFHTAPLKQQPVALRKTIVTWWHSFSIFCVYLPQVTGLHDLL